MVSSAPELATSILKRQRLVIAGGLALLVALAWWFLANGAGMGRSGMASMQPPIGALVLMWWLMMMAMMLPSAAPIILLYTRVLEQRGLGERFSAPWVFALGYAIVWLAFALAAAAVQSLLAAPEMRLVDSRAASGVLMAAGIYQLSPLKNACLSRCRSPAQFLSRHWRPGIDGAIRLGALHGAYCVGCCWMLMALLFVGGVMNFAWIAVLTLAVAIEKLVPNGEWLGRAAGVGLIGWGLFRLLL
jgi:predicted metal-binding membrane protein